MTNVRTAAAGLFALFACGAVADTAPADEVDAYVGRAIDIMQAHSLNRAAIDWPAFRNAVFARADGAETVSDAHPALRYALTQLEDRHSTLLTPAQLYGDADAAGVVPAVTPQSPRGELLDAATAYVWVPSHPGGHPAADRAYADALQVAIYRLDRSDPCGWIVDLRDNPGGNMWPMLAGLHPLMGDGTVGAFRSPDGDTLWWVGNGMAGSGPTVQATSRYAHRLARPGPPVALLVGPRTASSGEALAVAFRGRAHTRSFGEPTFGVPTGNRGFRLTDGSLMFVSASRFVDRAGTVYDGPIEPDVAVSGDDVLRAARRWLQQNARCRDGAA